jgi:hypothetical protein
VSSTMIEGMGCFRVMDDGPVDGGRAGRM